MRTTGEKKRFAIIAQNDRPNDAASPTKPANRQPKGTASDQ